MVPIVLCLVAGVLTLASPSDSRGMWVGVGFWLSGVVSWLIQELQALSRAAVERRRAARELADVRTRNALSRWALGDRLRQGH